MRSSNLNSIPHVIWVNNVFCLAFVFYNGIAILLVIGKKLPVFAYKEDEVLLLLECVTEARRISLMVWMCPLPPVIMTFVIS